MRNICSTRWACNLSAWLILVSLVLGITYAASAQKPLSKKAAIKAPFQGICGTVLFKSGNHMPGPDMPRAGANGRPVQREVLIYELTSLSQAEAEEDGFYSKVNRKLVKKAKSDKNGKFCVALPVGRYSLFVREEKGLYANLSDGQGNIFPIEVKKNRKTDTTVDITYAAVF
ncbi:hypothetical protein GCM10023189_53770 [Nibrella saemangeumensis]|uniref:Carboxypeptidase regulatory-like domain-containing protein n=1 Tax=Nibrella saemangeumensis TaxID=1084526 RepID=A0ABP8NNA5_9BACT